MDKQKRKGLRVLGVILIVLAVIFVVVSCVDSSDESHSNGASELYVKQCTEEFIQRFYNLKYPDTFKLKTIKYYKTAYESKGYDLWRTTGYFTAESSIGLEIKKDYSVYMQYKYDTDLCYALWVEIEDETYYGGSYKVDALI